MENLPTEPAAFWYLVAYIIIRDAIIPLVRQMLPAQQAQNAAKQKRENEVEDREISALETIGQTLVKMNERQVSTESAQAVIMANQAEHSKALAILVDRVAREKQKPVTRKAN